jgi:hypothetical protein
MEGSNTSSSPAFQSFRPPYPPNPSQPKDFEHAKLISKAHKFSINDKQIQTNVKNKNYIPNGWKILTSSSLNTSHLSGMNKNNNLKKRSAVPKSEQKQNKPKKQKTTPPPQLQVELWKKIFSNLSPEEEAKQMRFSKKLTEQITRDLSIKNKIWRHSATFVFPKLDKKSRKDFFKELPTL